MATTERTGALIALVPTDADLDRLTLDDDDAEPRDELHLTLWFLGEAAAFDAAARAGFVNAVTSMVERRELPVVAANAFGVAHWNPTGDDPAWVLNVGDALGDERDNENLGVVREMMHEAWHDGGLNFQPPPQHSPWQPHVCLAYVRDDLRAELTRRLGSLTFDRVRVAFGGEVTDVSLGQTATVAAATGGAVVPWHVVQDHSECPDGKPFAVVKDAGGDVEGCHASHDAANDQMAALYAAEGRDNATDADCVDCDDAEHFATDDLTVSASWDGSASRFSDEEYRRSAAACDSGDAPPKTRCFLPHHDPGGALNRAGLHAAAARINQVQHSAEAVSRARSHLRSHYNQLGDEVPDVLKAEVDAVTLAGTSRKTGDDCGDGYHRMPDGSCMSDAEMAAASRWSGVLIVEGTPTGDGREFAVDALTWADRALLRWQKEGSHGGDHDVTVSVGRIDEVWRDGNQVYGRGVLDLMNADGFELYRRMKNGFAGGISVDADDITDADVEFIWPERSDDEAAGDELLTLLFGRPEKTVYHAGRVRAATVVDIPAFVEAYIALADGVEPVVAASVAPNHGPVPRHQTETSDETWDRAEHTRRLPPVVPLAVAAGAFAWVSGDALRDGMVVRSGTAFLHHEVDDDGLPGAANLTACAAAVGALNAGRFDSIPLDERRAVYGHLAAHLRDAGREPPPATFDETTLVAAADVDAWQPPRAWFEDPKLSVPVGITVTDQGRVYGHAAQWGECHIGVADLCVTPPRETSHPYFMTGEVACDDGSRVGVGQITVGTGHAPLTYRASHAVEHYDNTGSVVADVAVGNDEHGIWVAGAVRPTAPMSRVHELRASGQVSGDWRRIGGQLRLVGLLAVNVPGFPVPRLRARVAAGAPLALIAAGQTTVGRVAPLSESELNQVALRRVMSLLRERVTREPQTEGA